jgi:hypothetical protein
MRSSLGLIFIIGTPCETLFAQICTIFTVQHIFAPCCTIFALCCTILHCAAHFCTLCKNPACVSRKLDPWRCVWTGGRPGRQALGPHFGYIMAKNGPISLKVLHNFCTELHCAAQFFTCAAHFCTVLHNGVNVTPFGVNRTPAGAKVGWLQGRYSN